jgi:hypothetical protein
MLRVFSATAQTDDAVVRILSKKASQSSTSTSVIFCLIVTIVKKAAEILLAKGNFHSPKKTTVAVADLLFYR